MLKNNFLDQFYTIDPETGDYIIEIAIIDYDDIFNNWDSSVYNIRDLDSSLKSFLEDCSHDIELNKKVTLRFNIKDEKKAPDTEETIKNGIRNYFNYCFHISKKKLSERRKKASIYVFISLIFTFITVYFQTGVKTEFLHKVLLQGLTVGSWVFLWEAFSLFFLHGNDVLRRKKQYARLLKAPMIFRYK